MKIATVFLALACSGIWLTALAEDEIPLPRPSLATFPHKLHQKALGGCTDCHGPAEPGKIDNFNSTWAHSTCIGCHRDANTGPRECGTCHNSL